MSKMQEIDFLFEGFRERLIHLECDRVLTHVSNVLASDEAGRLAGLQRHRRCRASSGALSHLLVRGKFWNLPHPCDD